METSWTVEAIIGQHSQRHLGKLRYRDVECSVLCFRQEVEQELAVRTIDRDATPVERELNLSENAGSIFVLVGVTGPRSSQSQVHDLVFRSSRGAWKALSRDQRLRQSHAGIGLLFVFNEISYRWPVNIASDLLGIHVDVDIHDRSPIAVVALWALAGRRKQFSVKANPRTSVRNIPHSEPCVLCARRRSGRWFNGTHGQKPNDSARLIGWCCLGRVGWIDNPEPRGGI